MKFFTTLAVAICYATSGGIDAAKRQSESMKCSGQTCTLTLNGRTYTSRDGSYANSMKRGGCPPAFCMSSCSFVEAADGCPMCKCDGYGTREPCTSNSDCSAKESVGCQNGLCVYADPIGGTPIKSCAMSNECGASEECHSGVCRASTKEHSTGTCVFDHQCPSDFHCDKQQMTCFRGGRKHSQKQCVPGLRNQCPAGQHCENMTCYYD